MTDDAASQGSRTDVIGSGKCNWLEKVARQRTQYDKGGSGQIVGRSMLPLLPRAPAGDGEGDEAEAGEKLGREIRCVEHVFIVHFGTRRGCRWLNQGS